MLPPPIGFTPLKTALDLVRARRAAAADAEREIAEACHGGRLKAAYRTWDGGADDLDTKVWQRVRWRDYFEQGTIDLDLPLIDGQGRPVTDGRIARGCTREIFITNDSLAAFVATLPPAPSTDAPRPKRGPKSGTLDRVVAEMQQDLRLGKVTVDGLRAQPEKTLASRYGGVSRDTVRKARVQATTGGVSKPADK
ncbi:hypothetical protein [Bradyrhizobium sp. S3.2.12]|uniref:hypothetical protein n=1 Tax=Bradyrhizobium sp. S3.2.12 TaxID=3156387 RepID=UPI00339A9E55